MENFIETISKISSLVAEETQKIFLIPVAHAQTASKVGNQIDQVGSQTTDQLTSMVNFIVGMIPLWITAFAVAIFSFFLARIVKASVESKMSQEGLDEEHHEIQIVAGRTAHAAVLIVGITVALKIAGLDLTPVIAAGAFGIGFALQDLIMNFLAGVMILVSRHYTIGDVISVNGTTGKIMEIQTRATIIKAFDGTKVIVPNAELFKNKVISKTSNPFRKLSFVMGVGYENDLKKVMDISLNTVKAIPGILASPKPGIIFYEWGAYSVNFKINVWLESKGGKMTKVKNKVTMAIIKAYNDAGISMPYPIQTIKLEKAEEQLLSNETQSTQQSILQAEASLKQPLSLATENFNSASATQIPNSALQPNFQEASQQIQEPALGDISSASAPMNVSIPLETRSPLAVSPQPTINSDPPQWLQKALTEQITELSVDSTLPPPEEIKPLEEPLIQDPNQLYQPPEPPVAANLVNIQSGLNILAQNP